MTSPPPEWVMLGQRRSPTEVMLIASTSLRGATLEFEREVDFNPWTFRLQPGQTTYTLTTRFRRYVMLVGPDYGTLLAHLLRIWTPGEGDVPSDQAAIEPARLQLEPPTPT